MLKSNVCETTHYNTKQNKNIKKCMLIVTCHEIRHGAFLLRNIIDNVMMPTKKSQYHV